MAVHSREDLKQYWTPSGNMFIQLQLKQNVDGVN